MSGRGVRGKCLYVAVMRGVGKYLLAITSEIWKEKVYI